MPCFVYILECSDGTFYTGFTHVLDRRLYEHMIGSDKKSYTYLRRPVRLAWSGEFSDELDVRKFFRQIKGWTRKKKQALINGDWNRIHEIVVEERKDREHKM